MHKKNWIKLGSIPCLAIILVLIVQVSCDKSSKMLCEETDCTGMLICVNDSCNCPAGTIMIGGALCINPGTFSYQATNTAGNALPPFLVIQLAQSPDDVEETAGQYVYQFINFRSPGKNNGSETISEYEHATQAPDGAKGDLFRWRLADPAYPAGVGNGYCNVLIEGTFTSRDTINALVTYESCNPANMPEVANQTRVKFIRVR